MSTRIFIETNRNQKNAWDGDDSFGPVTVEVNLNYAPGFETTVINRLNEAFREALRDIEAARRQH